MTLVDVLKDPVRRKAVVADGALLIEREVESKSGLTGLALKAGYATVKRLKPGIIPAALEMLLPEFAPAVDPFYADAKRDGDVHRYFVAHADAIAEALLGVTDRRAQRATNRVMVKVYTSLRGQAKNHVIAAVPGLADLIRKHV